MDQKPPANVVDSMQGDERIAGVREEATQYHLMLSDFSHDPLLLAALS
jgi:hypothetical protein